MQESKKAMGINALIIFISLVLVAAVAAGVIIQTSSSLESKSYDVGRQSLSNVALDVDIVQVYAQDVSDGIINSSLGNSDTISIVVKVATASSYISLHDLLIKLDTTSFSQTLISGNQTSSHFDTLFIVNGTNHKDHLIGDGDVAVLTFNISQGSTIVESETITLRIISKSGVVKPVEITTPSTMTEEIMYLYP